MDVTRGETPDESLHQAKNTGRMVPCPGQTSSYLVSSDPWVVSSHHYLISSEFCTHGSEHTHLRAQPSVEKFLVFILQGFWRHHTYKICQQTDRQMYERLINHTCHYYRYLLDNVLPRWHTHTQTHTHTHTDPQGENITTRRCCDCSTLQ